MNRRMSPANGKSSTSFHPCDKYLKSSAAEPNTAAHEMSWATGVRLNFRMRPVEALRTRAAAHQGSQRPRLRLCADGRGSHHRHRARLGEFVSAASDQSLSNSNEVS